MKLECDRCEREFEVPNTEAGKKLPCPHCGDINRVPELPGDGKVQLVSSPSSKVEPARDRAVEAGLPPDAGPEQRVMLVRPAMLRARPMLFMCVVLGIFAFAGLALWIAFARSDWMALAWMSGFVSLGGLGVLVVWKIKTLGAALEITNKRTVERRGLFSKATSEVVHDNIRNVQVDQTFWQRVWKVGSLGLSSSGQDGIEIHMDHVPKPNEVRRIIDLYRPL